MYLLLLCAAAVSADGPPVHRDVPYDLSTKTPYWSSPVIAQTYGVPESQLPGPGCKPVQVQHLGRHGTRYGSSKSLEKLQTLLQAKGGAIGNPRYQFLAGWVNPFPPNVDSQLNGIGMEEQYDMGGRHKKEFHKSVMEEPYNPDVYPFQATYKTRTSRSGVSFGLSAFMEHAGPLGAGRIEPISMYTIFTGNEKDDGDIELRPGANCPKYSDEIKDNKQSIGNKEAGLYLSENMTSVMVPKIAGKMELDQSVWELTMGDIELLMNACVMQMSILDTPIDKSPCAVFDEFDYEMFAFHGDLEDYYNRGPGYPLAHNLVCPIWSKMFASLQNPSINGGYYFTHSETLQPSLAFLGLYSDSPPLTASMSWPEAASRHWRTGVIAPMSVNLDLVAYQCQLVEGLLVQLRHNERPIMWPRCGNKENVAMCSPADLLTAYPLAAKCDFAEMCAL
eukprot:TRINITY_DN14088_c0_g1_i1.p1 TRINITY_DN14088_c0_g1~~TRINITY_DN14088_c0_g1_i1.p1  ORF type:complete len:448 (+),score=99.44 TRINITY_DN14088_c0_g1_i1:51-1394(+)